MLASTNYLFDGWRGANRRFARCRSRINLQSLLWRFWGDAQRETFALAKVYPCYRLHLSEPKATPHDIIAGRWIMNTKNSLIIKTVSLQRDEVESFEEYPFNTNLTLAYRLYLISWCFEYVPVSEDINKTYSNQRYEDGREIKWHFIWWVDN